MVAKLIAGWISNMTNLFCYNYSTKSGYKSGTKLLARLVNSVTSMVPNYYFEM